MLTHPPKSRKICLFIRFLDRKPRLEGVSTCQSQDVGKRLDDVSLGHGCHDLKLSAL